MTSQQWPFVVRRPDGFVGIWLDIEDQLTPTEARELARMLLIMAHAIEEPESVIRAEPPGYIVWERAVDGGRPHIRAVDLSRQKAEEHVRYLQADAQAGRSPEPDLVIEETRLDHLYAQSIMEAVRKRDAETKRLGWPREGGK